MSATSADIKKICHELLDRLLDAKVAFNADCIKLGKYDHDSANLRTAIDIDSALDAAKGAYAASVNGGNVRKTLESHHDMTRPGVGTRGLPGAAQEIEALITQICERDPVGDLWREAKAKAEAQTQESICGGCIVVDGRVDPPKIYDGRHVHDWQPDPYATTPTLRCSICRNTKSA